MVEQERILVNRCLQGDSDAWEAMVDSYGRRIGYMVWRYVRRREEVEDLTQEILLRVYTNLHTFRADTSNLNNWVVRVGRNLLIDRYRQTRNSRELYGSDELETLNLSDQQALTPEASAVRSEAADMLMEALDSLHPELRQVLVLRYMEGMSYQELADYLCMPEGTVKSRINRARAKLARQLRRQHKAAYC